MSSQWVDFRELRSKLKFADVLRHYHVDVKVKGDNATGLCPLPSHPRHEGKRRTASFSVNLTRNIFQCFGGGCGAKGNVLDFACYMEGGDPHDPQSLRAAALKLRDQLLGAGAGDDREGEKPHEQPVKKPAATCEEVEAQQKPDEVEARPVIVNAPLDFTLKMLDVEHPYLKQRGFTKETVSNFGLGYCSRGLMQERIVIPLHDAAGKLVGYAGRLADDSKISDDNPKYRFPGERERGGVRHEFHKSLLLFNHHRITVPVADLIVVEGFMSVFWLTEQGWPGVVALMGSSCSPEQGAIIAGLTTDDGRVWAFSDGDEAGRRCAASIFSEVGPQRSVRWVKLDDGLQPTGCDADTLARLLPIGRRLREEVKADVPTTPAYV